MKMNRHFTLRISQILVILSLELYHNLSLNENPERRQLRKEKADACSLCIPTKGCEDTCFFNDSRISYTHHFSV